MANKVASAALQYSKRLSKFICWIWAIYRFTYLVVSAIRPQAAASMSGTIQGLDWIMLVNEGTYLINSLGEKYIYSDRFILAWLNKGGYKNLLGSVIESDYSDEAETDSAEESEDTQEDENIDDEDEEDEEEYPEEGDNG